jgi:hypothetical protein
LRDLVGASLSVVRVLRFFGLSPLNVRGLTIVGELVVGAWRFAVGRRPGGSL